jgi:hypothetical protein
MASADHRKEKKRLSLGFSGTGGRMMDENTKRARDASEELDRLNREAYTAAVNRAFDVQKSGMRLSRRFFEDWIETLEDHAELNRRTMQGLTDLVREQREVFREMSRESLDAYDGFVDSLSSYYEEVSPESED